MQDKGIVEILLNGLHPWKINYQPNKKEVVEQLLLDNRVNYVCKSDFKSNSSLERLVKLILDSISISEKLLSKENNQVL